MSKITGNEPANPHFYTRHVNAEYGHPPRDIVSEESGLTIRQEFAARAMQGIVNGYYSLNAVDRRKQEEAWPEEHEDETIAEIISNQSTIIADALIEELNKEK